MFQYSARPSFLHPVVYRLSFSIRVGSVSRVL